MTKKCENCEYYAQYYIKRFNTLARVPYGHCKKVDNVKTDKRQSDYVCKQWKDNINIKEERNKSIRKTLCEISDHLIQISYILKDEEN